ncbi:MAG: hypothetical protein KDC38_21380, partial [Planctomycetes bacterium]|nr:hypothetical protein [Planctomycetota bacterium]
TQHDSEVAYFAPLELASLPADLVITNEVPATVSIRVAGPRARQTMLTPRKLALSLDLSSIEPGVSSFVIAREQLALPPGLAVTQISPERIRVEVERLVRKEVPVDWTTVGDVQTGFRLDRASSRISPEQVVVSLAESEADEVDRIETQPVDVDGLRANLRERVFLDRSDRRIRSVRPETVVLSLVIEEVVVERSLSDVPIAVYGIPEGVEVRVEPALLTATVRGPFAAVDPVARDSSFAASVDVSSLEPGEHEVTPVLRTPGRVEVIVLEPASVRVVISPTPEAPESADVEAAEPEAP